MSVLSDLFTDIAGAIRGKTGEEGTMKPIDFPDKIAGIETGGEVTPDYVGFATFMNGDVELYKMPFIKGYNCPNPLTEGLIETPTKESTVSTNYTYSGWDNNLTDLTEDVVVNAVFSESVRYYTINFYDGETLLESQSVAYGKTPSITKPEKDGYSFSGWNPELSSVTGNVDYYAVWSERVTFAGGTWADIARISEAGQAEEYFNLGDTKDIVITDGTKTTTITVQIVGFNHDDLSDGSGKAGLSIMTKTVMNSSTFASSTYSTNCAKYETPWSTSKDRKYLMEKVKTWLPQDLQAVLKTVNKISSIAWNNTTDTETTQDELWYPSYVELTGQASSRTVPGQGTKYEYFTDNTSRQKNLQTWTSIGTQLVGYGTRSHSAQYSGYKMHIYYTGVGDYDSDYTEYPFGFCV